MSGDGEPNEATLAAWNVWLAERSPAIQELGRRLPPWKLYRVKSTGQLANLVSYGESEDGTVDIRANVWQEWCPELTGRQVFGMSPDDFEPLAEMPHE